MSGTCVLRTVIVEYETKTNLMDFTTWLCCCLLSKQFRADLCGLGDQRRSQNFQRWCSLHAAHVRACWGVKYAAQAAALTISFKEWTWEDPRCSWQHCPHGGKTGQWVPPLLRQADHWEGLWWRNSKKPLDHRTNTINCGSPQMTILQWMARSRRRTFARPPAMTFVVCCEACGENVRSAVDLIALSKRRSDPQGAEDFQSSDVLLGVDFLEPELLEPGGGRRIYGWPIVVGDPQNWQSALERNGIIRQPESEPGSVVDRQRGRGQRASGLNG